MDGWIARRLRQVSRLGELLDPLADRLYILATLLAFTAREVVPWQFTAALLARELLLLGSLAVLRRYGYGPPPVHYVGKTATFLLLAAFPVLLLATRCRGGGDGGRRDRLGRWPGGGWCCTGWPARCTWCRRPGWCARRGRPAGRRHERAATATARSRARPGCTRRTSSPSCSATRWIRGTRTRRPRRRGRRRRPPVAAAPRRGRSA